MPISRTWGIAGLGVASFLLAVGIGFALAPDRTAAAVPPADPGVTIVAQRPPTLSDLPPAPVRKPVQEDKPPAVAQPRPAPAEPADPRRAEGEVLGGLQIVVEVDKVSIEPGEALNIAWKLVNHLDTPVQYLDVKPAITIVKDGWKGSYVAAGKNRPAAPEDLKQVGPKGTMNYERSIEWPKALPNQPDDWPDYSKPGTYKLTVGYKDDPSIPALAEQLQKDKKEKVYSQPLVSGTVIITVKGATPQALPSKTTETINEDF